MSRKSTLRKRTQRFADDNLANARTVAKTGRKAAKSGWNELTDVLEGVADRTSSLAGDTKSRLRTSSGKARAVAETPRTRWPVGSPSGVAGWPVRRRSASESAPSSPC